MAWLGSAFEPGAEEEFEYVFEAAGELLAGRHEPGHYAGAMVPTIRVRARVITISPRNDRTDRAGRWTAHEHQGRIRGSTLGAA